MWETILHVLGICPDHLAHFNLLDLLVFGPVAFIMLKAKSIYYGIKNVFNKKNTL